MKYKIQCQSTKRFRNDLIASQSGEIFKVSGGKLTAMTKGDFLISPFSGICDDSGKEIYPGHKVQVKIKNEFWGKTPDMILDVVLNSKGLIEFQSIVEEDDGQRQVLDPIDILAGRETFEISIIGKSYEYTKN